MLRTAPTSFPNRHVVQARKSAQPRKKCTQETVFAQREKRPQSPGEIPGPLRPGREAEGASRAELKAAVGALSARPLQLPFVHCESLAF